MSMITEQIKQLREHYKSCDLAGDYITRDMLKRAADTIETLSAKIHAYAMERSSIYYAVNCGDSPEKKIQTIDAVIHGELTTETIVSAYKKALEDIRAEIVFERDRRIGGEFYESAKYASFDKALEIIDKHDPSKAGKETETWNSPTGQIEMPKGTFERIYND